VSCVLPSKYLLAVALATLLYWTTPADKLPPAAGASVNQQPTEQHRRTDVPASTGQVAQEQPTPPVIHLSSHSAKAEVRRTFSTVPGQDYDVAFDVARFPASDDLEISSTPRGWHDFTDEEIRTAHLENGNLLLNWKFEATGRTTTIRFSLHNKVAHTARAPTIGHVRVMMSPVDLGTTFHQEVWGVHAIPGKPSTIRLAKDRPSAMVGEPINLLVFLGGRNIWAVIADRDYYIRLTSIGAEVTPNEVTIRKGEASAQAEITSTKPAQETVKAESIGGQLLSTQVETSHCGSGTVQNLSFSTTREQAPADNRTEIPFCVDLTDDKGSPVSDGADKSIEFRLTGVGRMISTNNRVPGGQCRNEQSVVSDRVGTAIINAKLGIAASSKQRTFSFFLPPLSFVEIISALLGGVAGAFVSAAASFQKTRRWRYFRWILQFISGAITGVCLYLAYYFGLTKLAHLPMSSSGLAFLCGTVGGYGGPTILNLLRNIFTHPPTNQPQAV
jgi:Protein of unknown function (DUF642)